MAGCMTAYYLGDAGLRVAIIEPFGIGSQASGKSAGGLNPLHGPGIPGPLSGLAMDSFRLHLDLWKRLEQESEVKFYPRIVKRLFLAFDDATLSGFEPSRLLYENSNGFSARLIDAIEVRKLDHRISPDVVGALYTEGNAAIEPLAYNQAISELAVSRGAKIFDASVTGLDLGDSAGRASGLITDKGVIRCDHVVLAMGAWGHEASGWLGTPIPVEPLKGELLLVDIPGQPLGYDITDGNRSLFCRGPGHVWIGATETREGYDSTPTEEARHTLLERGIKIMPIIADVKIIEHTAGLRPVAPDDFPIVGRAPGWENVYLNGAAGRKGTLMSAGMGKAVADLITQGKTPLPIESVRPDRFAAEADDAM